MALPKWLITVTPFSKALALSMLVVFPIVGFLMGMKYQQSLLPQADCNYLGYCEPTRMRVVTNLSGHFLGRHLLWIIPLVVVDLFLKGFALWNAGKNKQSGWFVALFIINSLGVLPLLYLIFVKPKNKKK